MKTILRPLAITITLSAILFCFSCTEISKSRIQEYKININDIKDSLQSSIKSYSVLRLDNNPDAYFPFATKFILSESYLIFRNESKQSIIIFDNSGKHINTIAKRGRGPGEYSYISDFMFDEKAKEITICDNDKLKKYSFTGEFISEQKLDSKIFKVTRMKNGNLITEKVLPTENSETNYYIRVLNDNLEEIDKRLPIINTGGPGFAIEGQSDRTSLNKDYGYFFSYSGDTIYHIAGNNIIPAYLLKYDRDVRITSTFSSRDKSNNDNAYKQLAYYEIYDKSLLFLTFRTLSYCFILDHTTGLSKSLFTRFPINGVYNNQLIVVINSMNLKRAIDRIDPKKTKCKNLSDLENDLQNFTDDFQVIITINLDQSKV